jgi:hypothetical protein
VNSVIAGIVPPAGLRSVHEAALRSGTLQILVNAATTPPSPGTLGGFVVVGGAGDHVGLRGAGSLVGTATENGIVDAYRAI